jgi:hypothetical protein
MRTLAEAVENISNPLDHHLLYEEEDQQLQQQHQQKDCCQRKGVDESDNNTAAAEDNNSRDAASDDDDDDDNEDSRDRAAAGAARLYGDTAGLDKNAAAVTQGEVKNVAADIPQPRNVAAMAVAAADSGGDLGSSGEDSGCDVGGDGGASGNEGDGGQPTVGGPRTRLRAKALKTFVTGAYCQVG